MGAAAAPAAYAYIPQGSAGSYAFIDPVNAPQARWNPCAPITVMVNERQKPGAADDVQEALWRLGQASGLVFQYQGTTDFIPQQNKRELAGTDLVVSYVLHSDTDVWGTDTTSTGYGSPTIEFPAFMSDGSKGGYRIRSAFIVIDSQTPLPSGFDSTAGTALGEVIMHEAGHTVGLGHVNDTTQIMNPTVAPHHGQWGAGDLTGLSMLGSSQGCLYAKASDVPATPGSVPAQPADPFPGTAYVEHTLKLTSLAIPARATIGGTVHGTPGARVWIQVLRPGTTSFVTIRDLVLDGTGTVSSSFTLDRNITFRALDPAPASQPTASYKVAVRSTLNLVGRRTAVRRYTFSGTVTPHRLGQIVRVYQVSSTGALTQLGAVRTTSAGVYTMPLAFATNGTRSFIARTPADAINAAGQSARVSYAIS